MYIVADQNIPLVENVFSNLGTVKTYSGREINNIVLKDASVLLVRSITKVNEALLKDTNIQFVASATIGTDHIDFDYLKSHGIGFGYAPGSNADSVAEYVVSALTYLSRKQKWDLAEKTIGIIGVGNVGGRVYTRSTILGMECLLNDPPKQELTQSSEYLPLHDVIGNADIVTIHVPLSKTGAYPTYHLADDSFFSRLKDGAIFINTSRGKVVDEKVLQAHRGRLGGVVLDVWETEPILASATLQISDIATPHIAGYSFDGKINGTKMIYEAACSYFGKIPAWTCPSDLFPMSVEIIPVQKSDDPLFDAIAKAYPITEDDMRLRPITSLSEAEKGPFFDELRRTYWRRYEFRHFEVHCTSEQSQAAKILSDLGFRVKQVG